MQFYSREKRQQHLDHFGVQRCVVGRPQKLRANLIELPVAALLRPLPSKHRPQVVELYAAGARVHPVLDIGTDHRCRRFRTQGDLWTKIEF